MFSRERGREQERLLRPVGDLRAQPLEIESPHVDAVEEHGAGRRIEDARQEREQRDLPDPVRPTSATVLPAGTSSETSRSAGRVGARVR